MKNVEMVRQSVKTMNEVFCQTLVAFGFLISTFLLDVIIQLTDKQKEEENKNDEEEEH